MGIWDNPRERVNMAISLYKAAMAAVHSPAGPGAVWFWVLAGVGAAAIAVLLIKIHLLRKAAREIQEALAHRLENDTNTLICVSSGDRYMRSLAASLNRELVKLRAQRRRFRQGDRELKNAVTNISHDLRTPLTAICGYLDLLEAELAKEAPGEAASASARYLAIIRERTKALRSLTEELFRYSVIMDQEEELRREPVALHEAIEDSLAAHYTALKEQGINPTVRMPEKRILRSLDRSALSRILSNLLGNAVKYSRGDLEIRLSENGEIVFSNIAPDLDELQLGRLFDRFYTVASGQKSTGLGLSIARTLTAQMKGSIWAEYEDGRLYIHLLFPE